MTNQQGAPEALRHADGLESFAQMLPAYGFDPQPLKDAAATVRSLHALALELADQLSGKNERLAALVDAQQPAPPASAALSDDLRDRLVAISEAIADQDDRAAQAMLREILKAPQPSPTPQADSQPAPVRDESAAPKLRAMAINYPEGASWDKLDAQTCMEGALEIEALRAARAPADSVTAPAGGVTAEPGWKSEDFEVTHYPPMPTTGLLVGMPKGVKVTHRPTGLFAVSEHERSQHRNRELAWNKLQEMLAAAPTPPAQAADSVTAPAGGAVAAPALAPSAFVNAAGIKADDKPGTVVRKLDAAFHDAVTFADAAQQGDARLWCVHVQGPDDVIAMPSKSAALEHANDLNALFGRHPYEEGDPIMRAVVIEWPHSADSHAADLVIQDATHGAAPTPPAQAADSVLEDAARLDWLALAGPTSICLVIDRPHDSEVEVSTDDVTGYGKTLREALDAARKQGGA